MKKLLSIILIFSALLSLTACGKDATNTKDSNTDSNNSNLNDPQNNNSSAEEKDESVQAQRISKVVCHDGDGLEQWRLEYQYTYEDEVDYFALDHIVEYSYEKKLSSSGYDKSIDRIISKTVFYSNGEENYYCKYEYDDAGILAQMKQTSEGGRQTNTYTHNEYGDVTQIIIDFGGGDTRTDVYEYEYDASGKITQKILRRDDEEVYRLTYTYNNNNLVKVVTYRDGVEKGRDTYEYDQDGKLITHVKFNLGSETNRTNYQYDQDGWLAGIEDNYGKITIHYEIENVSKAEAEELGKIVESLIGE